MRLSQCARLWLLAAVAVVACAPALTGTWVYDDWTTARHPAQDGLDDLLRVFVRDSSVYMANDDNPSPIGVTYRPLSMASLIAVQALLPRAPWAHHLVSLVLHLVCALGLYVVCTRRRGSEASPLAFLLCAGFALHPVTIEAYAWINGRSDVLAGAFVAALACALCLGTAPLRRGRVLAAALSAAGAAFSKEPAVLAVAALMVAALLPARGLPDRTALRRALPLVGGALLGLVVALLARVLATRGHVSGAAALFGDPELVAAFARTVRLAIEHVVVPLPRSMLCLSHELSSPTGVVDVAALLCLVTLLGVLALRGHYRAAVLIATASLSLLPVTTVRHLVWLGFDRYLYVPLFLLCLACADLAPRRQLTPRALAFAWGVSLLVLTSLGLAAHFSARNYRSQDAWLVSLVSSRPEDPSGYIMAAAWFLEQKDYVRANEAVQRTPREGLTPPLSHDLIAQLVRLGYPEQAVELAERTYRAYADATSARFDAFQARVVQGRFEEARPLVGSLQADPTFCGITRKWLTKWGTTKHLPEAQRASTRRLLAEVRCQPPSARARE